MCDIVFVALKNISNVYTSIILDYTSAQIMYFEYFIGGSFDDMVLDWKWVNGSIIDPNYLMNYPVAGGPGACLIWSDIHYLYDYPCSISIPAICDIPMTTSSGEIRTVILGLLIKTKATMMITCILYRIKTIINFTLCLKDIIYLLAVWISNPM